MPEPVALSWRGRLTDDYAVNLTIVEDDERKLPNCLAPSHPALQGIENIFEPVIHIVDLQRANHPALRPKVTRTSTSRLS